MNIAPEDISIRTELKPGDIGYAVYLHGLLYKQEYNYGIEFESYVAAGLHEFYTNYDKERDRVWICEYQKKLWGFFYSCTGKIIQRITLFYSQTRVPRYRPWKKNDGTIHSLFKREKISVILPMDHLRITGCSFININGSASAYKRSSIICLRETVTEQRYDLTVYRVANLNIAEETTFTIKDWQPVYRILLRLKNSGKVLEK